MKRATNPYQSIVDAGIPTDNHESDLYALATPESVRMVEASGWSHEYFRSHIDGKIWIDLPFAYQPFWDKRAPRKDGE